MKNKILRTDRLLAALVALLALFAGPRTNAQTVRTWTNTGTATAWYTAGNWGPSTSSGGWATNDTALFQNSGSATLAQINMNTAALSIGAIHIDSTRTRALTIENNGTNATRAITLNGATVNSVANTILRNASGSLLTFRGGTAAMGFILGNTTENRIYIDGAGGITISNIISGTNSLSLSGSGTGALTLAGANTFGGSSDSFTMDSGTTLNLNNASALGNVANTFIINGGTIDNTSGGAFTLGNYGMTWGGDFSFIGTTNLNLGAGAVNLTGTRTVTVNANALTVGGTITNTGGLTKAGAGTLILGGANTYSGTTLVNAGTLVLSNVNALQNSRLDTGSSGGQQVTFAVAGNNTYNIAGLQGADALAIGGNTLSIGSGGGSTTYSGSISGTGGALTKTGVGTLILSGNSSYTGATTIGGGTLVYNGTNTSTAVTINSGGTLSGSGSVGATTVNSGGTMNPGNSPGTQTYASLTWEGGANYNWQLYDANGAAGTGYDTFNSTGAFTINATSGNKFNINLWTLSGIAPDANGNALNFNAATTQTWTLGTFGSISGFSADAFSINTFATNGTGGFANTATGTFSINTNSTSLLLVYTAPVLSDEFDWSGGSGNWNTGGNWTNGVAPPATGAKIYYSGGGGLSTNNVATAIQGLTFRSGASAYTLEGNALSIGALGIVNLSASTQTVNLALTLSDSVSFNAQAGGLSFGGAVTLGANTLTVTGAENTSIGGAIGGAGGLVKSGVGTLSLSGANNYSGGTLVNAGRLTGDSSSLQGGITNNAAVTFSQTTNGTYAGAMTGSGSLTKDGSGTLTLSGANTFNGGTTVSGGGLTASTATLTGGVAVGSGATFALSQTTTGTFSGAITGNGRFVKDGSGDVTLAGANTYSGGTLVSAGTLTGTASSLQGSITNNAAVVFVQTPNGTYGGAMSGSGSLTKSGTGTLTLSGANSYSGGTVVSSGTLAGTTGSLQGNINNSGTVRFDQTTTGSYAGQLSGGGALVKAGSGAVTLEGNNTYTGATTVEGGSLIAANNNSLSSSAVTMSDGSVLAEAGVTLANNFTIGTASTVATNFSAEGVLAGWDFNGATGGGTNNMKAGTLASGVINGTGLTRGSGVTVPGSPASRAWGGQGWDAADQAAAVTAGDFVTFTLAADVNTILRFGAVDPWDYRRSGTGPPIGALQYSTDGSSFTDITSSLSYTVTENTGGTLPSVSLSSLTDLANGTTLTFRIVNWGASAGTGTWYLFDVGNDAGVNDFVIRGQVGTVSGSAATGSGTLGISEAGSTIFTGSVAVNNTATFTAATGGQATFSGVVSGTGTALSKTGAGTVTLSGSSANTFTGMTTVSAGTLQLNKTAGTDALAGDVTVNSGAFLLISQSNQVNNNSDVTLSGGTITRGAGVNEAFASLNLTTGSFLDFGTGATGSMTFGTYEQNTTPSALLTINNFLPGNSITFSNALFAADGSNIGSYFTFGDGFVNRSIIDNGGNSFTITAIPEPSTYAAAIGLLSLMLWPSRKRLLKDAKKILGLTPPMRDRLARRASES
jgi:fibronectin-binding autotransporter adhesin